jgi:hypothetical protein
LDCIIINCWGKPLFIRLLFECQERLLMNLCRLREKCASFLKMDTAGSSRTLVTVYNAISLPTPIPSEKEKPRTFAGFRFAAWHCTQHLEGIPWLPATRGWQMSCLRTRSSNLNSSWIRSLFGHSLTFCENEFLLKTIHTALGQYLVACK